MSKFSIDYGNDYDYAISRLYNTLVMHKKGFPIYIKEIDGYEKTVRATTCDGFDGFGGVLQTFDYKDLDLRPVKLGYGNIGRSLSYMFRVPIRHYKQGLNGTNFRFKGTPVQFHHPAVVNTITNKYPIAMSCLESVLCGESDGKAFSRDFAFANAKGKKSDLLFRTRKVGTVSPSPDCSNLNFTLHKGNEFLLEMFEESINV